MRKPSITTNDIDSQKFIKWLIDEVYKVKNCAALCREIDLEPAYLSRVKNGYLPIPCSLLVKVHEDTGMLIKEIRKINRKEVMA